MKPNEELQEDVHDAIKCKPLLSVAEIGVTTKKGFFSITEVIDKCFIINILQMKNQVLKLSAIAFLCIAFTSTSFSQKVPAKTIEKVAKKPTKIEKTKVPKAVTESFIVEYPSTLNEGWYGYPQYDFYNDWYGYNPYLYEYNNPEYYVVEFAKDNVQHKAIYSKEGKKIAVHKKTTSELPKSISAAINKGSYSTWKIAKEKEEIFRDTELDKVKVYKIEVEKGTEKHHLYYSTDGDLLKNKTIK